MALETPPEIAHSEDDARSYRFYSGALHRIRLIMAVLGPCLVIACALRFGWRSAAGLAFGCLIGYINFHWLKSAISGFVDRASGAPTKQSGEGIVWRFVFRYILMAVGAYVILTVSPASLNGLLAGLFLPVAAIFCEAAYEVYGAVIRGI